MQKTKWKQGKPMEQVLAIIGGIKGNLDNLADGTGDPKVVIARTLEAVQDLQDLCQSYVSLSWDETASSLVDKLNSIKDEMDKLKIKLFQLQANNFLAKV